LRKNILGILEQMGNKNKVTHLALLAMVTFHFLFLSQLMREICQESQDGEVRQLSFFVNNSRMQDSHTFFLENNEKITVGFKITNHDQQNFRGWEEGCHQFDRFQIRSQSQNRMGERGCKASFCVHYLGEDDELCQEQGEITLTYNSNPAMRMTLLFSICN